jgi:predicted nuclease of predicted toxin-antitoxin system
MLKFIVDTHLPPNLARWLTRQGFDATHPYFLPQGERMTDVEIRQVAIAETRIIVTKDSDFFDYYLLKGVPPKVLLLEFGNIRNQVLLAQFESHLPLIVREFEQGADLLLFNYGSVSRY